MTVFTAPVFITSEHDLNNFESGEVSLDEWLRKRALKNHASGASRCFVVCQEKNVVGYYTLSAGAVNHEIAVKSMRRNMPDPLPVVLLGRLAVDKNYQNQGLGRALLRDAMVRAIHIGKEVGVSAMLVHAMSEEAKRFYLSCGFIESPLHPMTLMMSLETARSVFLELNP